MRRILRKLLGRPHPAPSQPGRVQLRMLAPFDQSTEIAALSLPAGHELVADVRSRHKEWIRLLDASDEFGRIDAAALQREILSTLIPGGAVLIDRGGELVACAAACFAKRFAPYALLNYVLVRGDARGNGIGRGVSLAAMRRAQDAGYPGMILQTDDTRLGALAMYLSLGFEPVLAGEDMRRRWNAVMEQLGLPFP